MRARRRTSIAEWLAGALATAFGGIALVLAIAACGRSPRPAGTVVFASGSDLESGNPLVTIHPLSRQVQRNVLFTTLARYDSTLAPTPYAARAWRWSPDGKVLTFSLETALRWHDGQPTTARDAAFTLLAARDPVTGYPRGGDLSALDTVLALTDSTVELRFSVPQ